MKSAFQFLISFLHFISLQLHITVYSSPSQLSASLTVALASRFLFRNTCICESPAILNSSEESDFHLPCFCSITLQLIFAFRFSAIKLPYILDTHHSVVFVLLNFTSKYCQNASKIVFTKFHLVVCFQSIALEVSLFPFSLVARNFFPFLMTL